MSATTYLEYVTVTDIHAGDSLRRKLLLAVPERNRQRAAHAEFTAMLPARDSSMPSYEQEWTALVEGWDRDHDMMNPYIMETSGEWIPFHEMY